MSRLVNNSLARGTQVAYAKSIEEFASFKHKFGFGYSWPASYRQVAAYIAYLSLEGLAVSTISSRLSGIAFLHKINGWDDPTDNFLVKKLKEGCKRQDKVEDSRCPITRAILSRLVQVLGVICYNNYEAVMFKAAFLLAFFGFLRVGEFAQTSHGEGFRALAVSDIELRREPPEAMLVHIRFSKTDQVGRGEFICIPKNAHSDLCPVLAMDQYLSIRPESTDGPLFIHLQGKPLTAAQFSTLLKKTVRSIGLNPSNFSAHSFRIGAATTAAAEGIPFEQIKVMGRWRSQCVVRYIRPHREIKI